ncbi:hypothetical protein [Staphylococcus chromogenes]|uniref:hypothetical protein n=1 Tax=Staphylococcus chromogenes TaxID=46126 RepID=UPI0028861126|nr:hypothetical protein [Staphylococcus chromogenes]MDT0700411.1 hypothetical protein [Staphylococcus chromogenes]
MITLTQDNGSCNGFEILTVEIEEFEIAYLCKRFFGWRTPTKKYKTFKDRLMSQGSRNYDEFINYCFNLGYGK